LRLARSSYPAPRLRRGGEHLSWEGVEERRKTDTTSLVLLVTWIVIFLCSAYLDHGKLGSEARHLPTLLLRAGDIELNPGPALCGQRECGRPLRGKSLHCRICDKYYHLQRDCSGLSRWAANKAIGSTEWRCTSCTNRGSNAVNSTYSFDSDSQPEVAPTEVAEVSRRQELLQRIQRDKPNCTHCRKPIRISTVIACRNTCEGLFHNACTQATRDQIKREVSRGMWRCPPCSKAASRSPPSPTGSDPTIPRRGSSAPGWDSSKPTLTILQWNADGICNKMGELEELAQRLQVDIITVQESKLTSLNRTPKLSGYSTVRKDRKVARLDPSIKGGGLLLFVRQGIPYRKIQGWNGGTTEGSRIVVNTSARDRLIITNIYRPPIRRIEGEDLDLLLDLAAGLSRRGHSGKARAPIPLVPERPTRRYGRRVGAAQGGPPVSPAAMVLSGKESSALRQGEDHREHPSVDSWLRCHHREIITGDFNLHHPSWGSDADQGRDSLPQSRCLINWCSSTNYRILNSGAHTCIDRHSGRSSAPDLSIASQEIAPRCTWSTLNELGSDHKPILISISTARDTLRATPRFHWAWKKADWSQFRSILEENCEHLNRGSIKKQVSRLTKGMLKAAELAIPRKKVSIRNKPYWDDELSKLRDHRNALREAAAPPEEWRAKSQELIKRCGEKKHEFWKDFIGKMAESEDPKKVWNTIKCLSNGKQAAHPNENLVVDGKELCTDKDKANAFGRYYEDISTLKHDATHRKFKVQTATRLASYEADDDNYRRDFTEDALQKIEQWADHLRIDLNPSKTECCLYSRDRADRDRALHLSLNGHSIPSKKELKFLGVWIDHGLLFDKHSNAVKEKMARRTAIIRALAHREWGWDRALLLRVYRALVESVVWHAAAAWTPWLSSTRLDDLDRAQREALRAITGLPRSTPVEAIYMETNVSPISLEARRRALMAYEKANRRPADDPFRQICDRQLNIRLAANKGLREQARAICNAMIPLPRSATEAVLSAIEQRCPDAALYFTDGSVSGGTTNGGSAWILLHKEDGTIIRRGHAAAGRWCNSYEAELQAITLALQDIIDSAPACAAILTDSQSISPTCQDTWRYTAPRCPQERALVGSRRLYPKSDPAIAQNHPTIVTEQASPKEGHAGYAINRLSSSIFSIVLSSNLLDAPSASLALVTLHEEKIRSQRHRARLKARSRMNATPPAESGASASRQSTKRRVRACPRRVPAASAAAKNAASIAGASASTSYSSAVAAVRREIGDPPLTHARTISVYRALNRQRDRAELQNLASSTDGGPHLPTLRGGPGRPRALARLPGPPEAPPRAVRRGHPGPRDSDRRPREVGGACEAKSLTPSAPLPQQQQQQQQQHLLHRLWAVRLGADDVACQLESPTAQQVAWTDQAGAAIQSRVGHSLVADLEGGAQQASVRRVNLLLERLRQRPGLGVVQQDDLDHRLEQLTPPSGARKRRNRPSSVKTTHAITAAASSECAAQPTAHSRQNEQDLAAIACDVSGVQPGFSETPSDGLSTQDSRVAMHIKPSSAGLAALHLALLLLYVSADKVESVRDDKAASVEDKIDSGFDILVPVSEPERRKICSKCADCLMCASDAAGFEDGIDAFPVAAGSKFEIHWTDSDPVAENRRKRIVDLTRPARYHCGNALSSPPSLALPAHPQEVVLAPEGVPTTANGLVEPVTLAQSAALLRRAGQAAHLPVLVLGGADPVDARVAPDGLVVGIHQDHLVELVGGVLRDPVGAQHAEGADLAADSLLMCGALGHRALATAAADADPVDDEALLGLVAKAAGPVRPGGLGGPVDHVPLAQVPAAQAQNEAHHIGLLFAVQLRDELVGAHDGWKCSGESAIPKNRFKKSSRIRRRSACRSRAAAPGAGATAALGAITPSISKHSLLLLLSRTSRGFANSQPGIAGVQAVQQHAGFAHWLAADVAAQPAGVQLRHSSIGTESNLFSGLDNVQQSGRPGPLQILHQSPGVAPVGSRGVQALGGEVVKPFEIGVEHDLLLAYFNGLQRAGRPPPVWVTPSAQRDSLAASPRRRFITTVSATSIVTGGQFVSFKMTGASVQGLATEHAAEGAIAAPASGPDNFVHCPAVQVAIGQHSGIFAAGCANSDAFAGREHPAGDDRVVSFSFECPEEAVAADCVAGFWPTKLRLLLAETAPALRLPLRFSLRSARIGLLCSWTNCCLQILPMASTSHGCVQKQSCTAAKVTPNFWHSNASSECTKLGGNALDCLTGSGGYGCTMGRPSGVRHWIEACLSLATSLARSPGQDLLYGAVLRDAVDCGHHRLLDCAPNYVALKRLGNRVTLSGIGYSGRLYQIYNSLVDILRPVNRSQIDSQSAGHIPAHCGVVLQSVAAAVLVHRERTHVAFRPVWMPGSGEDLRARGQSLPGSFVVLPPAAPGPGPFGAVDDIRQQRVGHV
uniref:PHD-type domain-containing protein n=1 Tax=Macrostomum lignano TaxID=282301 RepID=A0A1I8I854_9PLAT